VNEEESGAQRGALSFNFHKEAYKLVEKNYQLERVGFFISAARRKN